MDLDILNNYLKEGLEVLLKCQKELEKFTNTGNAKHFEELGLLLGRLSGTSSAVNLQDLSLLTKMAKDIGFKASQINEIDRLLAISALFSQLLKFIDDHFKKLRKGEFSPPESFKTLNAKFKAAGNALLPVKITEKM
jgi:hypothetical protein